MYGGAQYLVITGLAGHKGTVGIRPNHLSAVTLTLFLTGPGEGGRLCPLIHEYPNQILDYYAGPESRRSNSAPPDPRTIFSKNNSIATYINEQKVTKLRQAWLCQTYTCQEH